MLKSRTTIALIDFATQNAIGASGSSLRSKAELGGPW